MKSACKENKPVTRAKVTMKVTLAMNITMSKKKYARKIFFISPNENNSPGPSLRARDQSLGVRGKSQSNNYSGTGPRVFFDVSVNYKHI